MGRNRLEEMQRSTAVRPSLGNDIATRGPGGR